MNSPLPTALSVNAEAIPSELIAMNRWVLWRYVKVGTKWNKMPFQPDGKAAKSTDPSTWSTFDQALSRYILGHDFDGIGFCFDGSDQVHGIDIDDCIIDGQMNDEAKELLARVDGYAEISPSGTGLKLFTRTNLSATMVKKGIEIYTDGRYFTVTGHALNGHDRLPAAAQDLGWFVSKHFGQVPAAPAEGGALALYKAPLADWDLERVQDQLLPFIDPDCGYAEWVQVGQALYHQGNGGNEWLELWDSWSRPGATYKEDVCADKWKSFSAQRSKGHGPVTLASLIKQVGQVKKKQSMAKVQEYRQAISLCEDPEELITSVCQLIAADTEMDKINRNMLATAMRKQLKSLQYDLPLSDVKRLLKPKTNDAIPDWLEDWVYVTHEDKFFNVVTKRKVTQTSFNAMFNREVGGFDTENKAAVIALDLYKIPTPDKIIYLPNAPEMFDLNGVPCVNGYDPNSPPDIPADYTQADLAAIETVKKHMQLILTEPEAVATMLGWMAHNAQNPGKKIRWAPLIKGIEGDGKTVLGKMMSAVMGMVNVGVVSPAALNSQYSGWADGRCINVLEEIRMVGHNRHDVLNALKPYITNDIITVLPKQVNEYVAPNTCNYIAFTNHQDALPLEETDRRWWVQFTPFVDQAQLAAATGPDYFRKLHTAIEQHGPALRKWLLEMDIPDHFDADGQAPKSAAKAAMVSLNISDEELMIREVIEKGCPGVHKEVISTQHLAAALSMMENIEVPKTSAMARLLGKLGYSKMSRQVKWKGIPLRLWIRGTNWASLEDAKVNDRARSLLDSTIKDPLLD